MRVSYENFQNQLYDHIPWPNEVVGGGGGGVLYCIHCAHLHTCLSICNWHGFQSIAWVSFGISISYAHSHTIVWMLIDLGVKSQILHFWIFSSEMHVARDQYILTNWNTDVCVWRVAGLGWGWGCLWWTHSLVGHWCTISSFTYQCHLAMVKFRSQMEKQQSA